MKYRGHKGFPLQPIWDPDKKTGSIAIAGVLAFDPPPEPFGLAVAGNLVDAVNFEQPWGLDATATHAFVTSALNNSLTSVSLATPASPTVVDTLVDATALANPRNVIIDGNYAYVCTIAGYLAVVDISNPAALSIAGSVTNAGLNNGFGITKSGNYVYVGTWANRLAIVDVTTPTAPTFTGSVTSATFLSFATGVVVDGDYAYVCAQGTNRVTTVDVSVKASPVVIGAVQDATNLSSASYIRKSGNYLFVTANGTHRLTVVDVTVPDTPVVETSLLDATQMFAPAGVILSHSHAIVAADEYVSAVNVSDPTTLPAITVSANDATALAECYQIAEASSSLLVAMAWASSRLTTITVTGGYATPPPVGTGQVFVGATISLARGGTHATTTAAFNSAIGAPIDITRRFSGNVATDFATKSAFVVDTNQRHRFVSMKENTANAGITQAQWTTFLNTIPNDGFTTWVTGHHEPDNDGGGHTTTWFKTLVLATLHAAWVAVGSPSHIKPSFCLTSYLERDGNPGTSSEDWFPDVSIIDDFTFWIDPYDPNGVKTLEQQAVQSIDLWLAATSPTQPWGIAETGTKRTGANGVTWIEDGFIWARSYGECVAICWFHSDIGDEGPWWLDDTLMQDAWGAEVGVIPP